MHVGFAYSWVGVSRCSWFSFSFLQFDDTDKTSRREQKNVWVCEGVLAIANYQIEYRLTSLFFLFLELKPTRNSASFKDPSGTKAQKFSGTQNPRTSHTPFDRDDTMAQPILDACNFISNAAMLKGDCMQRKHARTHTIINGKCEYTNTCHVEQYAKNPLGSSSV